MVMGTWQAHGYAANMSIVSLLMVRLFPQNDPENILYSLAFFHMLITPFSS